MRPWVLRSVRLDRLPRRLAGRPLSTLGVADQEILELLEEGGLRLAQLRRGLPAS